MEEPTLTRHFPLFCSVHCSKTCCKLIKASPIKFHSCRWRRMRISPRRWGRAASSSTLRRGAAGVQRGHLESPAPAEMPASPSSFKTSSNEKASKNWKIEAAATPFQCLSGMQPRRGSVVQCTYITRGAPLTTRLRSLLKSEEAREFNHVQSNLPPESSPPLQPASSLGNKFDPDERPRAAQRTLKEYLQCISREFAEQPESSCSSRIREEGPPGPP